MSEHHDRDACNRGSRSPDRWRALPAAALCLVCAAGTISCDRSPTEPPRPATSTGAGGAPPVVIRIQGPGRVTPGESPRYAAIEVQGGATKDVTDSAIWSSSSTSVRFTSPGVADPATRGESVIKAWHGGKVATLNVIVLEPGMFKLSGSIVSEAGGRGISGAVVEVLSGTGRGLQTTTSFGGEYALYGVAGSVRIRASSDGFTPQVHEVVVTGDDATAAFNLAPASAPAAIEGAWTMMVAPSPSCRPDFPAAARGRTYQMEFRQTGTHADAAITSPSLARPVAGFPTTIVGHQVRLLIWGDTGYGEWTWPDVVDRLSPTELFGFVGLFSGTLAGGTIRGTFDGELGYWAGGTFNPTWHCRATDHAVTLAR